VLMFLLLVLLYRCSVWRIGRNSKWKL